jgi:hypothetical protein
MDLNNNYIKNTVFLNKTISDVYINVFLTKTYEINDYVDIQKDENIYVIDKQNINPYYLSFGFFDSIDRIKINSSNDLTNNMINYLNTAYTSSIYSDRYKGDTLKWFNDVGYNELINDKQIKIDEVTGKKIEENGLDKLEQLDANINNIISKSFYFPIDINK